MEQLRHDLDLGATADEAGCRGRLVPCWHALKSPPGEQGSSSPL
jgi:hypothetical protein